MDEFKARAIDQGLYVINMPAALGGEQREFLTMTEPGSSSELRSMAPALMWAVRGAQFRQALGKSQGTGFKLATVERVGKMAGEAFQIDRGTGLMPDLPLERIWLDAPIDRI